MAGEINGKDASISFDAGVGLKGYFVDQTREQMGIIPTEIIIKSGEFGYRLAAEIDGKLGPPVGGFIYEAFANAFVSSWHAIVENNLIAFGIFDISRHGASVDSSFIYQTYIEVLLGYCPGAISGNELFACFLWNLFQMAQYNESYAYSLYLEDVFRSYAPMDSFTAADVASWMTWYLGEDDAFYDKLITSFTIKLAQGEGVGIYDALSNERLAKLVADLIILDHLPNINQ
jgi:hypothetical protein